MMDKELHLKFTAVFLMLLMVLIPAELAIGVRASSWTSSYGSYGSSGSGEEVAIKSIKGQDGISGFRRSTDVVTITAQASLGNGTPVTGSNLEASAGGWALGQFQSCTLVSSIDSKYECTFTENSSTMQPGSHSYTVTLNNGTDSVASTSDTVVVDYQVPSIITFQRSTTTTANENMTVTFDVKDYAYSGGNGVGLNSVTITANGATQYTWPSSASGINSTCSDAGVRVTRLSETVNITLGTTSATYPIKIYAEDCFGQYIEDTKNVNLDLDAPTILTGTLEIEDSQGDDAEWLSNDEKTLNIYLEFRANDIDTSSIYGDFSDANTDGAYSNVNPTCNSLGNNTYGCDFVMDAQINSTRSYSFYFYVEDTLGNFADATLGYSLKYDPTGPVPTSFTTTKYYNGNYFIGLQDTNITIPFTEAGIGLNDSNVFIDLSDIGMSSSVQTDNASPSWTCKWYDVSVSSAAAVSSLPKMETTVTVNGTNYTYDLEARMAEVHVLTTTVDDLGNSANRTTYNLSVDVYDPIIISKNITTISADTTFSNVTVVGDYIYINYNVTDGSFVTMNISADDFTDDFTDEIICTDNFDGTHKCEYTFGPIENEGYYKGQLDIIIEDYLGNSITETENIDVLEIENGTTSYWTITSNGCSPNPIDRAFIQTMGANVYCEVSLSSSSATIYDLAAGTCTAQARGEYSSTVTGNVVSSSTSTSNLTLSSYAWMGVAADQPTLYVNFVTGTFTPQVDGIECECEIQVRSIAEDGTIITRSFESVNITFDVAMYDSPLGEINQTTWDEIEDIYDTWVDEDAWEIITWLNNFFTFSKKLCDLCQTIINVLNGLKTVGFMLGLTSATFKETKVLVAAGTSTGTISGATNKAAQIGDMGFKGAWDQYLGKYCAFVSCKLAFHEDEDSAWNIIAYMQTFTYTYLKWANTLGIFDYLSTDTDSSVSEWWNTKGSVKHGFHYTQGGSTYSSYSIRDTTVDGDSPDYATSGNTAGASNDLFGSSYATLNWPIDPRDNFIVAIGSLCIPAILYNLEKWRQIQCTYGNCLITSGQTSLPSSLCAENKAYAQCIFIVGAIAQLIPLANFLSNIQEAIAQIFSDPLVLVDTALSLICGTEVAADWLCKATPAGCEVTNWAVWTCFLYDTYSLYADVAQDIESYQSDDYWETDFDEDSGACGTFKDSYDALVTPTNSS